jgi:hypothetical protein
MTLQRLNALQWFGLLAGGLAFAAAHILGYGTTLAECNPGTANWGISHVVWEVVLLGTAAALVVVAETASIAVLLGTRDTTYESEPPPSRIRFLAIAAAIANVLFFMVVILDLVSTISHTVCRLGLGHS